MGRKKSPSAIEALRETALDAIDDAPAGEVDGEVTDAASDEPRAPRKPRPIDPSVAALFPPGVVLLHELLSDAQKLWREATQREAPSLDRLSTPGVVKRVDADAASGYLAVVTEEETWRAFVPREQLALVVALLLRRPIEEVARTLGRGPGTLEPAG